MSSVFFVHIWSNFQRVNSNLIADPCIAVSDLVNPEILARTLFSRNFAYTKFRENKTLAKWQNHSVFIDIGKFCLSEFFSSLICLLMLFLKIKISRKFPIYNKLPFPSQPLPSFLLLSLVYSYFCHLAS